MEKLAELLKTRAAAFDILKALADKETLTAEELAEFDTRKKEIEDIDAKIKRHNDTQALALETAKPVAGQETRATVAASPETDPYVNDSAAKDFCRRNGVTEGSARSLVLGGMVKMLAAGNGSIFESRAYAKEVYGENHPVTRALVTSAGASGGFIVPPDYMAEIIELLRPAAVVRDAGPRVLPMPRGTMQLPGQNSQATASYKAEGAPIAKSEQTFNKKVATFHKLTALVPVSNDMMRYADPAVDAIVRDDLVKVLALAQDSAFLISDGSSDSPRGFLSFANGWVSQHSGTVGVWNTAANSTMAVNGSDDTTGPGTTGGNFVTSTAVYTLDTVSAELAAADNKLDTAHVPNTKRVWFMHPRAYNYLFNLRNSLGLYVYRDEMVKGTLNMHPFKVTTQIPINYYNADGSYKNCSFVFLVEMTEAMILDSMNLEIAVSREGTYVDASGVSHSAFQNDETIIRAIAEHDFQMRHDQAIAVIQGVRWAPSAS